MLREEFSNVVEKIIDPKTEEEKKRVEKIIKYINLLNEDEKITAEILEEKWDLKKLNSVTNEDGYFKEFVKISDQEGTVTETEIFYLLKGKQVSCLHTLETTETWTWLGGEEISLFISTKQELKEIILNENNSTYCIEKGTLFGAKINNQKNDNDFGLVTCLCKPGFLPEHYKNPSPEEINNLCITYPNHEQVIKMLAPESKNSKNFIQSLFQFFICCIDLMSKDLYSNKEIFLRELISNASDAIEILQFISLTNNKILEDDIDFKITITIDKKKRCLIINDNGKGMTRNEVITNLGTIAKSGTKKYLDSLSGDVGKDTQLIGQFGVGFYSAFMVANKVTVETRAANVPIEEGVCWEYEWSPEIKGEYTIETITKLERGTKITLYLKEDEEIFLEESHLRHIITKYSDHIIYPIIMKKNVIPSETSSNIEENKEIEKEKTETTWETVNNATAIWTLTKDQINDEEYKKFYNHLTHDQNDPFTWIHNKIEGKHEYTTLLYIPLQAGPFDFWNHKKPCGLKLYVKRVFIMDDTEQFLPRYLRFVKGIIDSNDLPLNISREILQNNRKIDNIRSAITKRILETLIYLSKEQTEKYLQFWKEFGNILKEGLAEDFVNRDSLTKLLRFSSTYLNNNAQTVSLEDYVSRMKPQQDKIYYITAENFAAANNSPNLEIFRDKGIEVLLLHDRIDEWLVAHLTEFDGKNLQSVAKDSDISGIAEETSKELLQQNEDEFRPLLKQIQEILKDKVKEVRISVRLTSSPACVVTEQNALSSQMQRILQATGQIVPTSKPILELISNASDAIEILQFISLTNNKILEDDIDFKITITIDKKKRCLIINDNGKGMTRNEVITNLGTIAKSGTKKYLDSLSGDVGKDTQLIGQFGVGFYSAFMVANKVTVETRAANVPIEEGVCWEYEWSPEIKGEYTIETITKLERGTKITLYLKEDEEIFLEESHLRHIITKYSDHIIYPIIMKKNVIPSETSSNIEENKEIEKEKTETTWETVNNATAIWTLTKDQINDEEYKKFYNHLTHDQNDPFTWIHNKIEGKHEYTTLLYIPLQAGPFDFWNHKKPCGLKLYVKRVFIMDDTEQFLPRYLRFVKGIIDSNDLPLNISREILQNNRKIDNIRSAITKRILETLIYLSKEQTEKYLQFWKEFGNILKEGLAEDFVNRDSLTKLLRFSSTYLNNNAQTVSLEDYVSRMKPQQDKIYYITAENFAAANNSPNLEIFRDKGIEVLLLHDRIDEWLVAHLTEFDGKNLQSVAKDSDISGIAEETSKELLQQNEDEFRPLLKQIQEILKDKVKEVRISVRLTSSPACVVTEQNALSSQMQRILQATGQIVPTSKPILELNTQHKLIQDLKYVQDDSLLAEWSHLFLEQSILAEGGQLEDPAEFVKRLTNLLLINKN
ncbi:hypothetical protein FQR65_LT14153 [Abscondita terminalis]|nr:hypothetical protein FQR65_LT14153 [Abscondita terminalis]